METNYVLASFNHLFQSSPYLVSKWKWMNVVSKCKGNLFYLLSDWQLHQMRSYKSFNFARSCQMLDKDLCILKIEMILFLDDRCPYHMSSIYPNIAKTFKTGPCWTNEPKDERTDIADPTAPSLCAKEERENKLWFTCLIPLRWVLIPRLSLFSTFSIYDIGIVCIKMAIKMYSRAKAGVFSLLIPLNL